MECEAVRWSCVEGCKHVSVGQRGGTMAEAAICCRFRGRRDVVPRDVFDREENTLCSAFQLGDAPRRAKSCPMLRRPQGRLEIGPGLGKYFQIRPRSGTTMSASWAQPPVTRAAENERARAPRRGARRPAAYVQDVGVVRRAALVTRPQFARLIGSADADLSRAHVMCQCLVRLSCLCGGERKMQKMRTLRWGAN